MLTNVLAEKKDSSSKKGNSVSSEEKFDCSKETILILLDVAKGRHSSRSKEITDLLLI